VLIVLDPFNLVGIITGKGAVVDRFWERENPVAAKCLAAGKRKGDEEEERGEIPTH
jgi:hypothetical protein